MPSISSHRALEDGGAPKTARRLYYLALSHGYITPDMGDTPEAKRSPDAAYELVTSVVGELRKSGDIGWGDVLDLTRTPDERSAFESPAVMPAPSFAVPMTRIAGSASRSIRR